MEIVVNDPSRCPRRGSTDALLDQFEIVVRFRHAALLMQILSWRLTTREEDRIAASDQEISHDETRSGKEIIEFISCRNRVATSA